MSGYVNRCDWLRFDNIPSSSLFPSLNFSCIVVANVVDGPETSARDEADHPNAQDPVADVGAHSASERFVIPPPSPF